MARLQHLIVGPKLAIPLAELEFRYARSSGPGGQNVNKVNSKATLRWPVASSPSLPDDVRARFMAQQRHRITSGGDLLITSQRFRDAGRNSDDCLEKLRAVLLRALQTPKARRATRPTRSSVRRRLEAKRRQSDRKGGRTRRAGDE